MPTHYLMTLVKKTEHTRQTKIVVLSQFLEHTLHLPPVTFDYTSIEISNLTIDPTLSVLLLC